MLAFLASGSRANALNLSSARTGGNSVVGRSTTTGLTSSKSANAAGSEVRRSGVRLTAKYGPSAARTSCVGSRNYCTVTVEGHKSSSTRRKYTDEDLLNNTVEANGFLILGEKEVQVDVPYWEKMTETAFNQMRFSDAVSAYDHIRGIGPNAPYLSDLHIRALDSLGAREDDILAAYRDMRQRGVKILSESYAKVLKALFKRGEKARVVSIFELMQSEGTPGTPEVYAVLLSLYYKENAKDIESALGILSTMKSNNVTPNIDVLDRLLLFFAEADRNDLIKDMYTQYVQTHKVKARTSTFQIRATFYAHLCRNLIPIWQMGYFPLFETDPYFLYLKLSRASCGTSSSHSAKFKVASQTQSSLRPCCWRIVPTWLARSSTRFTRSVSTLA